jgi:ABC-type nitrate/sulfonate/bicarbonate transport system substrate-binding protein
MPIADTGAWYLLAAPGLNDTAAAGAPDAVTSTGTATGPPRAQAATTHQAERFNCISVSPYSPDRQRSTVSEAAGRTVAYSTEPSLPPVSACRFELVGYVIAVVFFWSSDSG